ncbi:putative oxysterol-binding protein [Helianthus annuus]|uniref:Oxysterol-binding protein n=1 Tax=Helianthus annuus TaxID=4232 RepID=A0A251U977_HELAN|nr:putative oxysterol-binding protein [Helianthus annuus]KAJ0540218.1 putative oxysterol-binding protein [Helianthus annuus]KAJ0548692.1 putative oxysterol-binding protein [Helianthus annuus]KAJ0554962.1 putative oxysterol-binding protein [Helianthus annuus]KAJ0720530.1 putative oxysterol-binding protein [Helianthus annuus]
MPPLPPHSVNNHHVLPNVAASTRVSGILEKWVNCGKGWKPRWFVLQDGVLSYYKIHGLHKIIVSKETDKGSRVIGSCLPHHRRPLGELHLKVSSIRESRSDDRRFSIFTGTTRLHLRANSPEDQTEWMEALKATKQMFPRMSNKELMLTMSNEITVSTELLRARLSKEGVNEEVIQDAERIMKTEFSELQTQLAVLRKKLRLLIDRACYSKHTFG